ncbi:putative methyltransferase [Citrus sinensis]|uniref:Methyltransferase n=2 Tax=Citrus sinensis TaxID=2711 RepID=A0ACB8M7V8_CITSI|nr:putative methyltransferase [Citrus sinensis]
MFLLAKNSMQPIVRKFEFRKIPQDPKFIPSCKNNHAAEKNNDFVPCGGANFLQDVHNPTCDGRLNGCKYKVVLIRAMCIQLEKLLKQPGVAEDFKNSLMDGIHMAHMAIGRAGPRARPVLTTAEHFDTDKLCLADDSITRAKVCILLKLNFEKQWKGFTEDLEIPTGAKVVTCETPLYVEVRIACTVAQMEREGGISPWVSPLAQDVGELVACWYDDDLVHKDVMNNVRYSTLNEEQCRILNGETAHATAAIYDSMFAAEDGSIPATFQAIYMTGWREHYSQPKPKRRGSATVSFKDIHKHFGSENQSAQPS